MERPHDLSSEERRAAHRLELVSAFAQGIICEFDSECRYCDVWATDERLLALPADELIGRTIIEALGEDIGRVLMTGTARVFATGVPETFEYTLPLAMGRRSFEAQVVRIRAAEPEVYRAAALIRDVTEQRELGHKLAEAERLASLGVLAAGIGHEINNPLMVVRENARLMKETLAQIGPAATADDLREKIAPMRSMLIDVLDCVQRMETVVADLKLFRREDDDTLVTVDPQAAVRTALGIVGKQIQQRARLETDLQPLPHVAASESKLVQVLLNLLVNATQAIGDGNAHEQRIRIATRTDERGWAIIEVADTGCGVPAEEISRIFDPFYTTKREGMGLGLSVCQRIVTSCGGTIDVASEIGSGTTFRIALPAQVDEARDDAKPGSIRALALPRMRILLIDDKPSLVRVLEMSLQREHDIVTADGADAALALIEQEPRFDAIVCDLMMPLGDGMTFHAKLGRTHPELQEKIIFMTGGAFTPQAESFLRGIPNPTLHKPFGPEQLLPLLARVRT